MGFGIQKVFGLFEIDPVSSGNAARNITAEGIPLALKSPPPELQRASRIASFRAQGWIQTLGIKQHFHGILHRFRIFCMGLTIIPDDQR